MTRMFSMIFVILFFFIMVLCAFQPIMFANALETDQNYTLTIVDTEVIAGANNKVYLMLDNETPLTARYLMDNPDYFVNTKSTAKEYNLYAEVGSDNISLRDVTTSAYNINYSVLVNAINYYSTQYGDEFLDAPLYLNCDRDTTYTIVSAWNYELTLLEKMAIIGNNIFGNAQTVISFIAKTPLLLITFGLSLLACVIAIVRRVITVG